MQLQFLSTIVVIFGLSILSSVLCASVRVPAVVGFLIAGVLAGPHGLGLVHAVHEVEVLAEIGIVLLLFTIGIEFSVQQLVRIKRAVLLGGALQGLLTIGATFGLARLAGYGSGQAALLGFLMTLSSTAIVLKLLQERAEVNSPHGQVTLGILIFQDIAIVPMMLLTPLLAGTSQNLGQELLLLLGKGAGVLLVLYLGARWLLPWALYQIARTRSREIFLMSIVAFCFAVAWLTSSAGLSLGLGSFLAGLILAESDYSHDALERILPFRDVFTSLFFVSIGMLLDLGFVARNPALIFLATASILLIKGIVAGTAVLALGLPLRSAVLAGLALSQVGEFSFVLSKIGVQHGLLEGPLYQLFLATSVLTMAATPFVLKLAPLLADAHARLPLPRRFKSGWWNPPEPISEAGRWSDHLVIVGFGVNGRNLARAARAAAIPYVILEMNAETVRDEGLKGEPISYGDATQEAVLEHAGIRKARIAVLAVSDPMATRRITEVARRLNPKLQLIVRTRYVQEMSPLYALGANDVIPEEFETSVEIFTRVLLKYLIPRETIQKFIGEVRSDGYEMFRSWRPAATNLSDVRLHLDNIEICKLPLPAGSAFAGQTLAQAELRKRHGVTLLALRREGQILANPDAGTRILPGDMLYMLGTPEKLAELREGVPGWQRNRIDLLPWTII